MPSPSVQSLLVSLAFGCGAWACDAPILDSLTSKDSQRAPSPSPPASAAAPPAGAAVDEDRAPFEKGKPNLDESASEASVPAGYTAVEVHAVGTTPAGNVVVLVEPGSQKGIPIFIGQTEALSIGLRLDERKPTRPLTHDLLDNIVTELGGKVQSVRVERLADDIFYGRVVVQHGSKKLEFDARSSDAIALALGSEAPIYVAQPVLARAGVALDALGEPRARAGVGGASGSDRRNSVRL